MLLVRDESFYEFCLRIFEQILFVYSRVIKDILITIKIHYHLRLWLAPFFQMEKKVFPTMGKDYLGA